MPGLHRPCGRRRAPRRRPAPRALALAALLVAPALAGAAPALAGPVALDGIERAEVVLLPLTLRELTVDVHAARATVFLDAADPGKLREALRATPSRLCPGVEPTAGGVALRCETRRLLATVSRVRQGLALRIAETRGLPWTGDDRAALVPLDLPGSGGDEACPGRRPARRAECLLRAGDVDGARAALRQDGDPGPAAQLRLGDLALAAGDVAGAASHWGSVRGRPWDRLASARLCELSWRCLQDGRLDAVYATDGLPPALARDLALRRARTLAFLGRPLEGVRALLDRDEPEPCSTASALCRELASAALEAPGTPDLDALALWVYAPEREAGPAGRGPSLAAAALAEREGAPLFAANVLARAVPQVDARELRDHLLRVAELYLSGGDPVRAGVILEFARSRAGAARLPGARWAAVARRVAAAPQSSPGENP